jgi:multiple sugar transport system substrate-binding protein
MANKESPVRMTRRQMLKLSGALVAGSVLAACGGETAPQSANPTSAGPTAAAALAPTAAPAASPVSAATAQAPAQGKQAKVVVMHDPKELTPDMIKQFEAANPEIKIDFIERDPTRFFAMYAAGNPPDLVRTQAPDIPQYLARNMLMDLTPYFQTSQVVKLDDLAPSNDYYKANSPLEIGQGKIYGMCKDWSPDHTLFAYKKAFDEAGVAVPDAAKPLTYQEVFALARKLTKRQGDRTARWGYAYDAAWVDRIIMNMLAEKGQKLYTDNLTRLDLTGNGEAKVAAKYFFDLAKENLIANPLNPSPSWIGEDFTKGTVGLIQYGFWFSAMAESDVTKGQVVMLPAPMWAGQRLDPTITATGMVMSASSKVPDAAWKLFEWFNGEGPAVDRSKSGWGVPALKSMYQYVPQQSEFQKQAQKVLQDELTHTGAPIQFSPYISGNTFADSWAKNLEQALRGSLTFDQMLENVEKEVNAAIQEGKERIG